MTTKQEGCECVNCDRSCYKSKDEPMVRRTNPSGVKHSAVSRERGLEILRNLKEALQ